MFVYAVNIVLAIVGLYVSLFIYKEKNLTEKNGKMICPLGGDCQKVVNSQFSKLFGISIEYFGMIYYFLILFGYITLLSFPYEIEVLYFVLAFLSLGGFLFSLYLLFIQAFLIRNWCLWCLISAGSSTFIFLSSASLMILRYPYMLEFLGGLEVLLVAVHIVGFAVAISSATVGESLFLKFLKDFFISPQESKVMRNINQIVFVACFFIFISGLGIYLGNVGYFSSSPEFVSAVIIFCINLINLSWLTLYVSPKLVGVRLNQNIINIKKIRSWKYDSYSLTAISLVSWYFMFALIFLDHFKGLSVIQILSGYLIISLLGVIISQFFHFYVEVKNKLTLKARQKMQLNR